MNTRHRSRLAPIALLLSALLAGGCQKYAAAEVRRGTDGPPVRLAAFVDTNYALKERQPMSTARDFDFLVGTWEVANRRLKVRHAGSGDWDEFPGRLTMRPMLGGQANVDEVAFPTKGWSGLTLRLFNPATKQWSIYWVNSREVVMTTPVVGSFRDGIGEFYGDDTDEGRAIRVRYRWSGITATSARWEQAFSTDGGRTWETNWTAQFRRVR